MWGHHKVIHGFLGIFGGFIKGLRGSLCHFGDSYCTVILIIIIVLIYCSFLNGFEHSAIVGKGFKGIRPIYKTKSLFS